jgi:DNA polymerase-1
MIHSFMRSLNAIRKKFPTKEIIVAWESHGTPSWRRGMLPTYKPGKPFDGAFIQEIKDLQILLHLLGITQYSSDNNEADDVIATYVHKNNSLNILIFTVDKDIMQLVNGLCHIYDGHTIYDEAAVLEKLGVMPDRIPDLLALCGDSADNIEGIEGIGRKKATQIIKEYGSVENIPFPICSFSKINLSQYIVLRNKKLTLLNKNCELKSYVPELTTTIEAVLDKYELVKMKEDIKEYKTMGKSTSLEDFF